ncbi:Oidioi.mRNA.OKI2018_I69.chr2.g4372.t1.cds [Oikopleura dioica]|uniref:Oidioi.mRNA.OKI2018_I69.chr2.g4372.t1.cds n=1 Tax=Oikopleura dioica TaxID=34765 RepID=A0ABN7T2L8_OIKDI|nr:Oidioi.mRNA.OKI2018_I69.chr2.g4372.t1.cds [Oikopleura dioica]
MLDFKGQTAMLYKKLWYLAALGQTAPVDKKGQEIDVSKVPHPGRALPSSSSSKAKSRTSSINGSTAKTSTTVNFNSQNKNGCVALPDIPLGTISDSCSKPTGDFDDDETCQVSCTSGETKTIQCVCSHQDLGFTRIFMGCNYDYPDGECTDEPPTTEPPTTEPPTVEPVDPPSSEEIAILEQQVEDLAAEIEEITAQFLSHHELQTENIEGFFVMSSLQLIIIGDENIEASKRFIENQVDNPAIQMFRVQDIEAITESEFISLADIPNPDTSLNSFFKVTFEAQIDPNAENARSAILLIDDGRKDQFSRNGALMTTSCLSDDNTSTLARGISAIPGAIAESVVGIRCSFSSESAHDIEELKQAIQQLQDEVDPIKDIDPNRYDDDIEGLKTGHDDVLHEIELIEAKLEAWDNKSLDNYISEDIGRVKKTMALQEVQNIIQQGKIQNLIAAQNRKIEEQSKEVEELKSLLLAERHQQRLDFKMLEKEVQEQLKVESIVLQAQLKSEIKESVYEMQKEEMTSKMLQDLMNPESYYIRQMLRSPLDDKGEKLVTELIKAMNIRR